MDEAEVANRLGIPGYGRPRAGHTGLDRMTGDGPGYATPSRIRHARTVRRGQDQEMKQGNGNQD